MQTNPAIEQNKNIKLGASARSAIWP